MMSTSTSRNPTVMTIVLHQSQVGTSTGDSPEARGRETAEGLSHRLDGPRGRNAHGARADDPTAKEYSPPAPPTLAGRSAQTFVAKLAGVDGLRERSERAPRSAPVATTTAEP